MLHSQAAIPLGPTHDKWNAPHPLLATPLGPTQDEWGAPHLLPMSELPGVHGCSRSGGQASKSTCMGGSAHQVQQQHGPKSLQQAIADQIQAAAYDSGSSDNLAVVVLDIAPEPSAGSAADSEGSLCDEAIRATSACECLSLPQGCTDSQWARDTASGDEQTYPKQRSKINQEPDKIFGHASPAETASDFEPDEAPEWPDVTLWRDVSQILLGSSVGRPEEPAAHYKLLQQMAELPRYADHVHTSWAGLPVLSSMSLWLQPHLPRFATSPCPTSPHPHAEGGVHSDVLWGPGEGLEASLAQGSSQVMLSPGTTLQLVPVTDTIPASCSWDAWDSSSCTLGPAEDCFGPLCDASSTQGNTDWLTTTSVALAQVTSSINSEALTGQDQALPDDGIDKDPADTISSSNSSYVQRVPGTSEWQHDTVLEWQKYHRGRNFARGSFGEVWHAERASAGEPFGTHGVIMSTRGCLQDLTLACTCIRMFMCPPTISAITCTKCQPTGSRSTG